MKIKFYNFLNNSKAKVKGGQEKYLDYLTREFKKNSIKFEIVEKPSSLKKYIKSIFSLNQNTEEIEDTIHIFNGNSALYQEALKRRTKNSKTFYIQHSSYIDRQDGILKMILRLFLLKLLLLKINKVIRVSNKTLPNFFSPKKIKTIYSGVPLPKEKVDYLNSRKKARKFKLLMIGNICKNKNQELAIKILPNYENIELTIVGSGNKLNYLKKKYSYFIDKGNLIFTGQIENPSEYIMKSHALLILSKYEGLPLVLLEAMSYGLPVISSRAGGIEEIIINNKNGLLLEKNNLFYLKKNIEKLLNDKKLYGILSENSRILVKKNFTTEIMFNNIYQFLK